VRRFFTPAIEPRVATVVGRDEKALADFARRFEIPEVGTSWRTAVESPDIDLVDLVTPNDLHAEPALAALAAGKHVACEKPLARDLAEARTMRDAAKRAKGKTFVWFNYRRCPAVAFAWRLVREGAIGEFRHVRAHYLQSWGGPETPMSWRFLKKRAGSGAHGDLNAHVVDLARFLAGEELVEVHGALARTFVKERREEGAGAKAKTAKSDVDDALSFLASFKGGATASFEASRVAHGHLNDNGIELNGTKGSLRFRFEDMNVLELFDATLPKATAGWRRILCTSPDEHPYVHAWWPDAHLLGYEHGFVNMAADILAVLVGKEPEIPLPDFEDAYRTQRVLEAALVAARERRAVKLAELR
jgi:predicted dehydrogenase